eukprot:3049317-Rhodomonas_salina.1
MSVSRVAQVRARWSSLTCARARGGGPSTPSSPILPTAGPRLVFGALGFGVLGFGVLGFGELGFGESGFGKLGRRERGGKGKGFKGVEGVRGFRGGRMGYEKRMWRVCVLGEEEARAGI